MRSLHSGLRHNLPIPAHTTNGDEQRYSDKSATYSKPIKQDAIALVNPAAFASFKRLASGLKSDYENIILGGTHTLNGPQASYAYDLRSNVGQVIVRRRSLGWRTASPGLDQQSQRSL
ncbi:MAG: hypothetical protein H0X25_03160 [Acidobacteriales bacterium]|nr:hypothetical protein [Terriglobales bacterium]